MMTMASVIPASVPQSIDLGFDLAPAVLVVLAVLAVGVLGTLLSALAADRQAKDGHQPYVSLHLRPQLKAQ